MPDLAWLGLPEDLILHDSASLPFFLFRSQTKNLFDRIARSVQDLGSIYDATEQETSARDEAIAGGALVLIEGNRQAYWDRKPIKLGNSLQRWTFLWLLADRAGTRRSVMERDLFPDVPSRSAMPTLWHRFREKLPLSLEGLVEPDPQQNRAYRLNLEPERIYLFREPC